VTEFLEILVFSFSITGPIFVILALGIVLERAGIITDAFIESGTRLVFNIALPALLFISISKTRLGVDTDLSLIAFGLVATLVAYVLLEWYAARKVSPESDRGVVVQGGFRSNMGIIGLAYCVNAYGEPGLLVSSLYLGLVTILFNILSVITLSRSLHKRQGVWRIVRGIATNPLIIAIGLALPVSWFDITLPALLLQSGQYFADLTLPLALLCTGASLNFRTLRGEIGNTLTAAACKLLVIPVLFTLVGALLGFRGIDLGVLMLMSSAPTATASYVMVRAMGGNATLAANIVALTTLGSLFTTSLGIMALKSLGMM
jgi:predicted permease